MQEDKAHMYDASDDLLKDKDYEFPEPKVKQTSELYTTKVSFMPGTEKVW